MAASAYDLAMPFVESEDVRIHYQDRGEGTPVLGVMGFALDQRYWAAQIPAVTKSHRFITLDNRGVGKSRGPAPTSVDEMAEDALSVLDHLGIEQAVIFGASLGGAIAQRLILDHPERAIGLILAVTYARPMEFMRRQHDLTRRLLEGVGINGLVEGSLLRMFTPEFFEVGREVIDRMAAAFMADEDKMPPVDVLTAQLDALDKHDALADLHTIQVPTLVIGAKMDVMVPYLGSKEIAQAIPGAEFVTFETGHGCMVEEMDAFNATLEKFLAQF